MDGAAEWRSPGGRGPNTSRFFCPSRTRQEIHYLPLWRSVRGNVWISCFSCLEAPKMPMWEFSGHLVKHQRLLRRTTGFCGSSRSPKHHQKQTTKSEEMETQLVGRRKQKARNFERRTVLRRSLAWGPWSVLGGRGGVVGEEGGGRERRKGRSPGGRGARCK